MKNKISGIYCIENLTTGKKYIGSSKDVVKRLYDHKSRLKLNKHHSPYLQNAYNKYGKDDFKAYLIEKCSKEIKFVREKYWMEYHATHNSEYGYNLALVTELGSYEITEEQREQRSIQAKEYADNNIEYIVFNAKDIRQHKIISRKDFIKAGFTQKQIGKYLQNNIILDKPNFESYFFNKESFTGCQLIERINKTFNANTGTTIYCYNKDNTLIHTFPSKTECASFFQINDSVIRKAVDQNYRIQRKYYISTNPNYIIPTPTKRKRYGGRKKRSVIIDGLAFSSVEHASYELNIPIPTLYSRLHSSNPVAAYLS